MIDQLSTLLVAATSLRTVAAQDILEFIDPEGVSIDFGEGIEGLENPAPFLEYLLRQYNSPVTGTDLTIKPQLTAGGLSPQTDIREQTIIALDGQELPSRGNRFPLVGFMSTDSELISLPVRQTTEGPAFATIEPTILSFSTPNRGAGIVQVPDHVLDLQSGLANVNKPLGNRVLWMVNQNVQAAELRVNPPNLGSVEVRISVEGDQTNVSLIAQHSAVREVMESAIPRLRDMLSESGLNLANIDISQQDLSQRRHHNSRFLAPWQGEHNSSESNANAHTEPESIHSSTVGIGLIDFYA